MCYKLSSDTGGVRNGIAKHAGRSHNLLICILVIEPCTSLTINYKLGVIYLWVFPVCCHSSRIIQSVATFEHFREKVQVSTLLAGFIKHCI